MLTRQTGCDLSIQGLSAMVYGTHNLGDFAYRGWGNPSAALQNTLQEMFPLQPPYLDEMFPLQPPYLEEMF